MKLKRKHDWEVHLHNYMMDCKATPFEYGEHDCGLFAAGAIEAITGTDVGEPFKKLEYNSLLGASKAIMSVTGSGTGISDAALYIVKTYELKEWPSVLFAQRGDLVLYEADEGWAAGIIGHDATKVSFAGEKGLRKVSVRLVSQKGRAWSVN